MFPVDGLGKFLLYQVQMTQFKTFWFVVYNGKKDVAKLAVAFTLAAKSNQVSNCVNL